MEIVINYKQCPKCSFESQCDIILNYHLKEVHENDIEEINDEAIKKCLCGDCRLETELKFGILKRLEYGNNEQYEISLGEAINYSINGDDEASQINLDHINSPNNEVEAEEDEEEGNYDDLVEEGVEYPTVYIEEFDESISTRSSPQSDEVQLYNVQYN